MVLVTFGGKDLIGIERLIKEKDTINYVKTKIIPCLRHLQIMEEEDGGTRKIFYTIK